MSKTKAAWAWDKPRSYACDSPICLSPAMPRTHSVPLQCGVGLLQWRHLKAHELLCPLIIKTPPAATLFDRLGLHQKCLIFPIP